MFWTARGQKCTAEKKTRKQTHLLLTGFEQIPVVQEEGLHLVDTARGHKDKVEDGKQTQLQIKRGVSNVPERETTEESRKNVQVDLVPDVVLQTG